jgi:DNA-binding NtrC family response regulator
MRHSWPGTVRELECVISSACITVTPDFIDLADLPEPATSRATLGARRSVAAAFPE